MLLTSTDKSRRKRSWINWKVELCPVKNPTRKKSYCEPDFYNFYYFREKPCLNKSGLWPLFNLTMRFFSLPSCQKISINKIAASNEIFQIFKFPECARIENINKNSFMSKWKVKKHFDFQPFSLMECMMAREPKDLPIPTVYPVNA